MVCHLFVYTPSINQRPPRVQESLVLNGQVIPVVTVWLWTLRGRNARSPSKAQACETRPLAVSTCSNVDMSSVKSRVRFCFSNCSQNAIFQPSEGTEPATSGWIDPRSTCTWRSRSCRHRHSKPTVPLVVFLFFFPYGVFTKAMRIATQLIRYPWCQPGNDVGTVLLPWQMRGPELADLQFSYIIIMTFYVFTMPSRLGQSFLRHGAAARHEAFGRRAAS